MKNSVEFKKLTQNMQYDGVMDLDPTELDQVSAKVKIIDVRQPEEYTGELGHIASSKLIPLSTLPAQADAMEKNENYIVVCRSGARSAQATAYLLQNGFKSVFNLKGGMILWNQLKLPTE